MEKMLQTSYLDDFMVIGANIKRIFIEGGMTINGRKGNFRKKILSENTKKSQELRERLCL